MSAMVSQITSLMVVHLIVYSGADQRKNESSASMGFVRGIHRWPVNSPHKGPVTRKMFPFDDVIMVYSNLQQHQPNQHKLEHTRSETKWMVFCRGYFQFNFLSEQLVILLLFQIVTTFISESNSYILGISDLQRMLCILVFIAEC